MPPPENCPGWMWAAAGQLYRECEQIRDEAMGYAQMDQDMETEEWEFRLRVSRIIFAHWNTHREFSHAVAAGQEEHRP